MARTWPAACTLGCCVLEKKYTRYYSLANPPSPCILYRIAEKEDIVALPAASEAECDRWAGAFFETDSTSTQYGCVFPLVRVHSQSKRFLRGSTSGTCCDHGCSYDHWTYPYNGLPDFDNGMTREEFDACRAQTLAAIGATGCYLATCLPATQADPIECFDLSPGCGASIPGSNQVGSGSLPRLCASQQSDPRCGSRGCCLCDWCCDLPSNVCGELGGFGAEQSCDISTTRTACLQMDRKKPCVTAFYKKIRKIGRWTLQSTRTEAPTDLPPGNNECIKHLAVKSRPSNRWQGASCNRYNLRCASSRKRQIGKKRRNSGRWVWRINYRPPCPAPPCPSSVGCPA